MIVTKEMLHEEVDLAFEIYEKLKHKEHYHWHRVFQMVEQLRANDLMLKEQHAKKEHESLLENMLSRKF